MIKQFNRELYQVKNDLLNDTLKSDVKYHNWIQIHRKQIFPTKFEHFDVYKHPQNYIKPMIYMCLEIEKNETKLFQFLPLRNDMIPKYIPIDTKSIIELLLENDKQKYLKDIEGSKNYLWNQYFNLSNKIFKQKNYFFDYRISTDGLSVSIQFIHKSFLEEENNKKHKMKEAKQHEIKKQKTNKQKIEKHMEYPYLEELNDEQLKKLKNTKWVVVDPGKRCLLYMKSNEGETFRYTNKRRMKETKRLKYGRLLKNHKNKNQILEIEKELAKYNSKSCNYEKFKEFIIHKNQINEILLEKYQNEIFRKYKWYAYINKKRSESNLINEIKKKFGKNTILIYGDWSVGKQMKNYISTPNIGIKRKLNEQFTIYSIDEFRTSILNYKTEEKCENMYLPDKKGVIRKIHSILTCQTENKRMECINRDENAVRNLMKLVNYYLENKERPIKYQRNYELKDDNPILGVKCHHA